MRVLRIQGMESESPLPFAALQRLLRPLADQLHHLPAPQASALGAALGLVQAETVEPFLVAIATLTLLTEAADEEPLICVVDDAHWLDPASAEVLLVVARRLDADRVGMIFAARDGEAQAFEAEGLPRLRLTGLDEDAAASLLSAAAPGTIAPGVVGSLAVSQRRKSTRPGRAPFQPDPRAARRHLDPGHAPPCGRSGLRHVPAPLPRAASRGTDLSADRSRRRHGSPRPGAGSRGQDRRELRRSRPRRAVGPDHCFGASALPAPPTRALGDLPGGLPHRP